MASVIFVGDETCACKPRPSKQSPAPQSIASDIPVWIIGEVVFIV
jgi:hypothetical protein